MDDSVKITFVFMNVFVCQLIPLQAPLKTMLQMSVVPVINSKSQNKDSRMF